MKRRIPCSSSALENGAHVAISPLVTQETSPNGDIVLLRGLGEVVSLIYCAGGVNCVVKATAIEPLYVQAGTHRLPQQHAGQHVRPDRRRNIYHDLLWIVLLLCVCERATGRRNRLVFPAPKASAGSRPAAVAAVYAR